MKVSTLKLQYFVDQKHNGVTWFLRKSWHYSTASYRLKQPQAYSQLTTSHCSNGLTHFKLYHSTCTSLRICKHCNNENGKWTRKLTNYTWFM